MAGGWAGFWGDTPGAYDLLVDKMPRRNSVRRVVNRDGFRALTRLFDVLVGAAPGGTATASYRRVKHMYRNNSGPEIGKFVEVVPVINRATTSADVAALKEMVFNVRTAPSTYPADRSGNGGKAFTG